MLKHIECFLFRVCDPVTNKLGRVSDFGEDCWDTQEGCYIIFGFTTEVFSSDLILGPSFHTVWEFGFLLDLSKNWCNLGSSAFNLEGPFECRFEAMEINNKSKLTLNRFQEVSHSCGFLFTEWGSTSIKLIAKVTLTPEVLSIVSI